MGRHQNLCVDLSGPEVTDVCSETQKMKPETGRVIVIFFRAHMPECTMSKQILWSHGRFCSNSQFQRPRNSFHLNEMDHPVQMVGSEISTSSTSLDLEEPKVSHEALPHLRALLPNLFGKSVQPLLKSPPSCSSSGTLYTKGVAFVQRANSPA